MFNRLAGMTFTMALLVTLVPASALAGTVLAPQFGIVRPALGTIGSLSLCTAEASGTSVQAGPGSGVEQATSAVTGPISILVQSGSVALHPALADGTTPLLARSLFKSAFWTGGALASVIQAPTFLEIPDGGRTAVFGAAAGSEMSAEGQIYAQQGDESAKQLFSQPGRKLMLFSRPVTVGDTRFFFLIRRVAPSGDASVCVATTDLNLVPIKTPVGIAGAPGWNYQAYSATRMSTGQIVVPVTYATTAQLYTGPWNVDLLLSDDDGATWAFLGQPHTVIGRGALEPVIAETTPGVASVFVRTETGSIYRAEYHSAGPTFGGFTSTGLQSPSAGLDVLRLADGRLAIAWLSAVANQPASSHPRKVLMLGISRDNLATMSSVHVVVTSSALGDSMTADTPYVHQPRLSEVAGRLTVSYERVVSSTSILPWTSEQNGADLDTGNVIPASGSWYETSTPSAGAPKLQVLAVGSRATFRLGAPFTFGLQNVPDPPVVARGSAAISRIPSRIHAYKRFSVVGFVTPRQASGSRPAALEFYRLEKHRWVLRKRIWPKVSTYRSGSRFTQAVALPAGTWSVRVRLPADSIHTGALSRRSNLRVYR